MFSSSNYLSGPRIAMYRIFIDTMYAGVVGFVTLFLLSTFHVSGESSSMGVNIEIDGWDPTRKYYGGDTLHGNVIITNNTSSSKALAHDLVIRFSGKAESHWKEQRKNVGHYRQYLTTTFDSEIYFEETIMLLNRELSVDNQTINPGRSEYPFTFQFPSGLPQSFTSDHGSVRYLAEVPYPKPWAPDHSVHLELQVGGHLDLNGVPREWSGPGRFAMAKTFWWGFGRVEAQLSLPSRTFVPLDDINFSLEVINLSRCYLKKIRVYFCQVTTYRAKGSEFKEGARLSKIKCKPVHPRGTATIEGTISVPEVPPTELGGCELIQPQYGIMIKVIATTLGKMVKSAVLEGRVPVLIGTVSLGRSTGVTPSTVIRPITALRQNIEFMERRVVLTPEVEVADVDRFTNLAG